MCSLVKNFRQSTISSPSIVPMCRFYIGQHQKQWSGSTLSQGNYYPSSSPCLSGIHQKGWVSISIPRAQYS